MPAQDKTGPLGEGPLTGRGLGPCGRGLRRGLGRGFGNGLGLIRTTRQPLELSKDQEKKILHEELDCLKEETKEIEKRIKELE